MKKCIYDLIGEILQTVVKAAKIDDLPSSKEALTPAVQNSKTMLVKLRATANSKAYKI